MAASDFPLLNAILSQLLAELQGYELCVQKLAADWQSTRDLVLFGDVGRTMDRMRALALSCPELSTQWLMVMISHTELMHNLWRVSKGEALDVRMEVEAHVGCLSALAARCRWLLMQARPVLH